MIKKFSCKKIFFSIYFVYIGEEKNKGGINMKIKPTNEEVEIARDIERLRKK